MFSVIEHKTLSTAQEIIGPECNAASQARKTIFPSLSLSLHLLLIFYFPPSVSSTPKLPCAVPVLISFFFFVAFSTLVSFNTSATHSSFSQQNDSLTYNVVMKLSRPRAVSVCLIQLSLSFTSLMPLIPLSLSANSYINSFSFCKSTT